MSKSWQRTRPKAKRGGVRATPVLDVRPIRIERRLFERLAQGLAQVHHGRGGFASVEWGRPDAEGFYTPVISWTSEAPVSRWQRLLQKLVG